MTDERTPGVLLKGADGGHYFIPTADLSQYAVDAPAGLEHGASDAGPQLPAFAAERSGGEIALAHDPAPEG